MTALPDSPTGPSRRKWWLWLPLAFFGVIFAFFLLGSIVVSDRASSRWKEFVQSEAALKARVLGRDARRELLEGPATSGNAWQGCVDAAARLDRMTDQEKLVITNATGVAATPETEKSGFAVLDAHAHDLEGFRVAARMESYRAEVAWEDGFSAQLGWLARFRHAGRVLALSARHRRVLGDLEGAIEDVATLFQMGVDCGRSGPLICWLVGNVPLSLGGSEARDILAEPMLTAAQAGRLEKLAAVAESRMVTVSEALEGERLLLDESWRALAEGRANLSDFVGEGPVRLLAWRQGFSLRIVAADMDDASLRISKETQILAGKPWKDAASAYARLEKGWESNPLLRLILSSPAASDRNGRAVVTRLRLLQAFAHERGTGTPMDPMPVDPFTLRPLHRRESPGGVLWWSEGADGDDDGGTGKFEDIPDGDGDIPLEWVRK